MTAQQSNIDPAEDTEGHARFADAERSEGDDDTKGHARFADAEGDDEVEGHIYVQEPGVQRFGDR